MARDPPELSKDAVFRLLSNPRRRYVIYFLRKHGREAKLEELTQSLAAWETGKDADDLADDERKRVYVSLYQTHIPKLEEHGVLEYDSDSTVVSLTPSATEIDRYLTVDRSPVPWQFVYLGVTLVGVVLLAMSSFDVWVLTGVDDALISGLVVGSLLLISVTQFIYDSYIEPPIPEELEPE